MDTTPVNLTNPNALENQPNGNGNAESLLHNITADKDSNAAAGDPSQAETSLSSKPEAIGEATAHADAQDEAAAANAATDAPTDEATEESALREDPPPADAAPASKAADKALHDKKVAGARGRTLENKKAKVSR